MTDKWWSPSEIRYTPEQVTWLLGLEGIIEPGEWPPECLETGYTGGDGGKVNHHAPFEVSCCIFSELDARLSSCSTDGELLFAQVKAQLHLSQPARQALSYVSGYKRKRTDYKTYRWQRTWRQNVEENTSLRVRKTGY